MATLYFNVEANYKEVARLTEEIDGLEAKLRKVNQNTDPLKVKEWQNDLSAAKMKLAEFVTMAAASGAKLEQFARSANLKDVGKSFEEMANNFKNNPAIALASQFDSVKKQVKELTKAVQDYDKEIEESKGRLAGFQKEAAEAMGRGDEDYFKRMGNVIQAELENINKLAKGKEECTNVIKALTGEEENETKAREKSVGIMEKMLGGTENYRQIMTLLPGPLKRAVSGINGVTKASLKFIATPLGAAVAAIALAFASLKSYFTKTEEGEMKLARATGYLKGALVPLEDIAIRVGKGMVELGEKIKNAFEAPREAVDNLKESFSNLMDVLKDKALDRWQDIKGTAVAFGKLFSDLTSGAGIKEAFKNFNSAIEELPSYKTAEKIAGAVKTTVKAMDESGKKMADISEERKKLEKSESSWQVTKANNQVRKDELAQIFQDTSLNSKWRQQALDEYVKILEEERKGDLGIAGQKIGLTKREQNLGAGNTISDTKALNSLQAEYASIDAGYESQLKSMTRTRVAIIREGLQEEKQLKDLANKNELEAIQNMEDNIDKEMELLMADYMSSLDEIGQLAEKWMLANGEALTDDQKELIRSLPENVGKTDSEIFNVLTDEQTQLLNDMRARALETLLKGRTDLGKAIYDQYKSQTDKEKDLEKEYLDDVARLDAAYIASGDEKFLRSKEVRKREYEKTLEEMRKASDKTMRLIFGNVDLMTKDTLDIAIKGAKEKLAALLMDPTTYAADIESYRNQLDKLEGARNNYDYNGWGSSLLDIIKIQDQKERTTTQRDLNKEALKGLDKDSEAYKVLKANIEDADEALKKLDEDQKKAVAGFLASKLTDTFTEVGASLREIGEEVNDMKLESLGETLEGIGKAASSIVQGFLKNGPVGGVLAIGAETIKGITNQIMGQVSAMAKAKAAAEEYAFSIKMLSLRVEELNNAFGRDNYGMAAKSWAKAKNALTAYNEQQEKALESLRYHVDFMLAMSQDGRGVIDDMLKQNGILGEDGLDLDKVEELYKAKGITDEEFEKLKELKKAYEDLKGAVEDYVSSLVGDTVGGIADEMIDGFLKTGSAIIDMTDNLNDFKKKLAESIVQSMLLQKVFTPEKQQQISDMLMSDNVPQAIEMFNTLLDDANAMSGEIEDFLKGINLTEDISKQSATAGGFQTMSQDTATELNGRFTALQISGENIESFMETLTIDFKAFAARYATQFVAVDDIRNIQAQSLIELQGINENTLAALKPIRTMNDTMEEIRKHIEKL